MGPRPLDDPRLLEIEDKLNQAQLEDAQRLLASLGDVPVHRAAITYFATRLLYQRGRLDHDGVVSRLRELVKEVGDFPEAQAMLAAAERGTLRPDPATFTVQSAPPPFAAQEAPRELSRIISEPPRIEEASSPVPRRRTASAPLMPVIPRAPALPYFTPRPFERPSYAPGEITMPELFETQETSDNPDELPSTDPARDQRALDDLREAGRYRIEPAEAETAHVTWPGYERPFESDADALSTNTSQSETGSLLAFVTIASLLDEGKWQSALSAIEREPGPHTPELALLEVRALWGAGRRGQALTALDRLTHAPLLEPEVRAGLARFLLELGQPERALEQARQAHEDDPHGAIVRLTLAWTLVRVARRMNSAGLLQEAAEVLSEVKARSGQIPGLVQALRACLLAETSDPERAISTAQLALGQDAGSADALVAIAIASAKLGRFADAQKAWQRLAEVARLEADAIAPRLEQAGIMLNETPKPALRTARGPSAVLLWHRLENELCAGRRIQVIQKFEEACRRELQGLIQDSATDAVPLLGVMAATFFTTAPVWRHFAPFDLSIHSMGRVSACLDLIYGHEPRPSLGNAQSTFVMIGAYLGECLRQSLGGKWSGSLGKIATMAVEGTSQRYLPFETVQRRLEEARPLSFGASQSIHPGAETNLHHVSLPVSPPTPWDPRAWPPLNMVPRLGLAFSQSVVDLYCRESAGSPLDRSISGLSALDRYIALIAPPRLNADPEAKWVRRVSVIVGAYLGEVLCDAVGARWREDDAPARGPEAFRLFLGDGTVATPVEQTFKRLTGKSARPLSEYVSELAREALEP